jgi:putative transposase
MATVTELAPRLGVRPLCHTLSLSSATYYRHRCAPNANANARQFVSRASPRALSPDERRRVLDVLHEPRFVDLAPAEVYATLLDEGTHLCSERTMYRVLAENEEIRELGHNQAERPSEVDLVSSLRRA